MIKIYRFSAFIVGLTQNFVQFLAFKIKAPEIRGFYYSIHLLLLIYFDRLLVAVIVVLHKINAIRQVTHVYICCVVLPATSGRCKIVRKSTAT